MHTNLDKAGGLLGTNIGSEGCHTSQQEAKSHVSTSWCVWVQMEETSCVASVVLIQAALQRLRYSRPKIKAVQQDCDIWITRLVEHQ